ncbi:hypothetical protein PBY51_016667 [Eleginops maclovinus]|uniref:Uncharacterized protein n=1 Tax=Eleginops maclovinus TaxID=56733 RepID=A0AAN7WLG3_ELEMC|nr:hypothetical protein PBY51_016667 [Eleginops maclovinus]
MLAACQGAVPSGGAQGSSITSLFPELAPPCDPNLQQPSLHAVLLSPSFIPLISALRSGIMSEADLQKRGWMY